jgi:UDP-galactopyranose mutase
MEIARAQETYRKWREQTSPDDITPELNLLGMLGKHQQYQEMERVIQEALRRQPDNEALKELGEWVVMRMKK